MHPKQSQYYTKPTKETNGTSNSHFCFLGFFNSLKINLKHLARHRSKKTFDDGSEFTIDSYSNCWYSFRFSFAKYYNSCWHLALVAPGKIAAPCTGMGAAMGACTTILDIMEEPRPPLRPITATGWAHRAVRPWHHSAPCWWERKWPCHHHDTVIWIAPFHFQRLIFSG